MEAAVPIEHLETAGIRHNLSGLAGLISEHCRKRWSPGSTTSPPGSRSPIGSRRPRPRSPLPQSGLARRATGRRSARTHDPGREARPDGHGWARLGEHQPRSARFHFGSMLSRSNSPAPAPNNPDGWSALDQLQAAAWVPPRHPPLSPGRGTSHWRPTRATVFPHQVALAAAEDDLMHRIGAAMARELAAV